MNIAELKGLYRKSLQSTLSPIAPEDLEKLGRLCYQIHRFSPEEYKQD